MEFIIAIGIFQALVAAALFLKFRLRNGADALLAALLICIAAHLTIKFFIFRFIGDAQVRTMMNTFLNFSYGPLLYLYALKLRNPAFVPASRWYVFVPLVVAALVYFCVASVLAAAPEAGHQALFWYNHLSFWTFIPADVIYSLLVLRTVRELPAALHKERLLARQLAACFLALSIMAIVFYSLRQTGLHYNALSRSIGYSALVLICVRIMRYRYLRPPESNASAAAPAAAPLFTAAVVPETPEGMVPPPSVEPLATAAPMVQNELQIVQELPEESCRNALSGEEMLGVWKALEGAMKEKSLYTDSDLSLDRLAVQTGYSKYLVSETLNRHAGKSFYQYVNEYRIAHVLRQLNRLRQAALPVNVLLVAYDAGFKSKSSFNRYFKDITGETPTDYLRALNAAMAAGADGAFRAAVG